MESSKKRIICIVLAFVAVVITATALTCVFVNRGQTENYKITVHPNNGQADFVWDANTDIPVIAKDGYHIAGYYLDAEMTKSASFASLKSTELTQDINVYVKWEEHVEATDAAVKPTCTEKGLTEGKHCSKCGKILTAQTEISALGHDIEHHAEQPATCTEKGCEEYVTCKRDGCTYTTYKEIPALDHDLEHHAGQPATCTEIGWEAYDTCKRDGCTYTTYQEIDALGHDIEHHAGQPATCTEKGCEEYVTCKRDGCTYTTYKEIPALDHDLEHHAGQPATCTEIGWEAYDTCKRDGCTYTTYQEIDALGHDIEHHAGQPATCTEKGWKAYVTCKRDGCTYTTYQEINALGHIGGTATCTEQAVCERCKQKYGDVLGHAYEETVTLPTCTQKGYTTHTCSRCSDNYVDTYVDALGHIGGAATCTEQAVCERCNEKYGKALGHDYQNGVCTRCGDELASEGLAYTLNSDGNSYTVTGIGSCKDKDIYIPSVYNSKPVTNIKAYAFSDCTNLTSVTIGSAVTSIGQDAFKSCTGLTTVNWNATACTEAGDYHGIFAGCTKLATVNIGNNVTTIPSYAFFNCAGLTSIKIGNSVTSIGYSSFKGCTGLTSITIPDSVTSIGEHAFFGCTGFTSIVVTEGNTKYHSTENCLIETERKTLILGCKNSVIPTDGSVTSIENSAFRGCTGLTNITIPDSVTSIGYNAFSRTGLTYVTIPGSVKRIGAGAFGNCSMLARVKIGDGVSIIGSGAFEGSIITEMTIPDSVTNIGNGVFRGCTRLTSITIPFVGASKTETEEYARVFGYIFGHTTTTNSSDTVSGATIQYYDSTRKEFYWYYIPSALKTVVIGNTATTIPSNAFYGYSWLKSVTIGSGVTSMEAYSFAHCSITSIYYTGDVAGWCEISGLGNVMQSSQTLYIGGKKVSGDLIIPDGVTKISGFAFYNCSGLKSIIIPASVTSIGNSAFKDCYGLTSITIGNGVTSIGDYAFQNNSLKSLTIPGSVTAIGSGAFYQCAELTRIDVSENNSVFSSVDGILYDKNKTEIIYVPNAIQGTITIPGSVTSIDNAFYNRYGLTSVTIENGVTRIEYEAFKNCTGLTSIAIPDSVTSIGSGAFYGCKGITSITIPFVGASKTASNGYDQVFGYIFGYATRTNSSDTVSGATKQYYDSTQKKYYWYRIPSSLKTVIIGNTATTIPSSAFENCTNITDITIGDSVTSIGDNAFRECTNLTNISIPDGVTSIGNLAFYETAWYNNLPNGLIYIGKIAYKYNGSMPDNTAITLKDGTVSIADRAFSGCTGLTNITIPDSVTSIAVYAFSNCTGLQRVYINDLSKLLNISFANESSNPLYYAKNLYLNNSLVTDLVIPDGIININNWVFFENTNIVSISIPASVEYISPLAFAGCSELKRIVVNSGNKKYVSKGNCLIEQIKNDGDKIILGCKTSTIPQYTEIPDQIKYIGEYAFYKCDKLQGTVTVLKAVSIGDYAFYGCTGLTGISFGPDLKEIGNYSFYGCTGLTSLSLRNTNKRVFPTIGNYAFSGCTGLTSLSLGQTNTIGKYAFSGCTGLTTITLPDSVTDIGDGAFKNCSKLTTVVLGKHLEKIGNYAFMDCKSLTDVTISGNVTSIGNQAFSFCKLSTINYSGTKAQWKSITKGRNWNMQSGAYTVRCTDGDLKKADDN